MKQTNSKRTISVKTAAIKLGVSTARVYQLIKVGKIKLHNQKPTVRSVVRYLETRKNGRPFKEGKS